MSLSCGIAISCLSQTTRAPSRVTNRYADRDENETLAFRRVNSAQNVDTTLSHHLFLFAINVESL
jgi:hypothetical protein